MLKPPAHVLARCELCNTVQECAYNGNIHFCVDGWACTQRIKLLGATNMPPRCYYCGYYHERGTTHYTGIKGATNMTQWYIPTAKNASDIVSTDSIRGITELHYQWLVKMGYTKATPLESLALITSEIGEAVNECRHGTPTDKFGEELADIVLRVFGLARQHNIDIAEQMRNKIIKNYESGDNQGRII